MGVFYVFVKSLESDTADTRLSHAHAMFLA